MNLWYQVFESALEEDTIISRRGGEVGPDLGRSMGAQEEHSVKAYNYTLMSVNIIQAVQRATIWEGWGVLRLDDACKKTGCPVQVVLQ